MKQVSIVAFLVVVICGSLSARPPSGALAEPLAPISCEVVDKVPVNGEVSLLLRVEAGECIESVSITWYSWGAYATSDTVTMQQTVDGADALDFPIVMRIPEPNAEGCNLTVRTYHKKIPMKEPCVQVRHYVGSYGQSRTSRREVSKEDEEAVKRISFRITDSSVFLTNLHVNRDFVPQVPDTSGYYTPWLHTPAESVRTPMPEPRETYTAPRELTDEGKRELDSLLGVSAPLTKAEKMAKLEEKPLEGMDRQFFELDGVMYVRDRGEREFRVSEPMTLEEMRAWALRRADSSAAIPPETEFEVRMWLTDSTDLEYARKQVDSLRLSDEPDCYITRTSLEVIHKLRERGIRLRRSEIKSP